MTVTDDGARDWAREESERRDSTRPPLGADLTRDFHLISRVLAEPELIADLKPDRIDRLVWRIPNIFTHSLLGGGYVEERLAVAQLSPEFLMRVFGDITDQNVPLEMFWDTAIRAVQNSDRALVDTIFDGLTRQLAHPNKWVQASAIHGFNHLREPRCRPLLQEFLHSCDDPHLADYARAAMTFRLM